MAALWAFPGVHDRGTLDPSGFGSRPFYAFHDRRRDSLAVNHRHMAAAALVLPMNSGLRQAAHFTSVIATSIVMMVRFLGASGPLVTSFDRWLSASALLAVTAKVLGPGSMAVTL